MAARTDSAKNVRHHLEGAITAEKGGVDVNTFIYYFETGVRYFRL